MVFVVIAFVEDLFYLLNFAVSLRLGFGLRAFVFV